MDHPDYEGRTHLPQAEQRALRDDAFYGVLCELCDQPAEHGGNGFPVLCLGCALEESLRLPRRHR